MLLINLNTLKKENSDFVLNSTILNKRVKRMSESVIMIPYLIYLNFDLCSQCWSQHAYEHKQVNEYIDIFSPTASGIEGPVSSSPMECNSLLQTYRQDA